MSLKEVSESCTCDSIKQRCPLGALALGLLIISGVFVYVAYFVTTHDWQQPPSPTALSISLSNLENINWCLNDTFEFHKEDLLESHSWNTTSDKMYSLLDTSIRSVCLQLVVLIPGDHYPAVRNQSTFMGSLARSQIFQKEHNKDSQEQLELMFYLQHNLSTSTRYSRDVLVPSYVNITATHSELPDYLIDASSCQIPELSGPLAARINSPITHIHKCKSESLPKFHVDKRWNINVENFNLDLYVSMNDNRNRLNIHLMYASYCLLFVAVCLMLYSLCRNRNTAKSKGAQSTV